MNQRWCHTMKHEGGAALLEVLRGLELRGRPAVVRQAHRETTQSIGNTVHRMDYRT